MRSHRTAPRSMEFSRSIGIILLGALILSTLGCVKTTLTPEALDRPFLSLAAANRNPINIVIVEPEPEFTLGHQFLFPIFPVGRINTSDMGRFLSKAAFQELSLAGYSPQGQSSFTNSGATLTINLKKASLSGYDLFLTRRLKCDLSISGVYQKNGLSRGEYTTQTEVSHYETYAFKSELENVFDECLRQAMSDLLLGLGLARG